MRKNPLQKVPSHWVSTAVRRTGTVVLDREKNRKQKTLGKPMSIPSYAKRPFTQAPPQCSQYKITTRSGIYEVVVELGRFVHPLTVTWPSGDGPTYVLGPPGVDATFVEFELTALEPFVLGDEVLLPDEPVADGDEAVAVADSLAMIELASAGEIVDVVVLAIPVPLPAPKRTNCPSNSVFESMKVIKGPAMSLSVACWTTLAAKGCSSEVMKIATGPLMPGGTTHWLYGKEIENARPPASIWQDNVSVEILPLSASDLKVREVPACIVPVFVTANDGLAGTPMSHPEMKPPAIAAT